MPSPSTGERFDFSDVPQAQLRQSAGEESTVAYAVGSRVRHAEFGQGKIMEKTGTGDALKVVVLFQNGQWKKLLVKYANLEQI